MVYPPLKALGRTRSDLPPDIGNEALRHLRLVSKLPGVIAMATFYWGLCKLLDAGANCTPLYQSVTPKKSRMTCR
jgi:hypothetical protein